MRAVYRCMNYLFATLTAFIFFAVLLFAIDRETRQREAAARRAADARHKAAEAYLHEMYRCK